MACNYSNYAKIFTILSKYSAGNYDVDAQHDILYLANDRIIGKITKDDMDELKRLGVGENSEGYLYIYT